MATTYTLAPEEEETARRLVAEGHYASIAEVVRAGLDRIAAELRDPSDPDLKRLCEEGEASGLLDEDGFDTLARLHRRYEDMAARQHK